MKLKLLILVLALQSAWILGTTFVQERALTTGKTILLETGRVDPRDLLRGDYLILNYKISDVPAKLFAPPVEKDLPAGTKIFVALAPGTNNFHEVVRASTNELAPAANETVLRGQSAGDRWNRWGATNSVHITYGIERFYVSEGSGNPTGKLAVQAVVPESGRASLKQVFLDGKPYAEAMKDSAPNR
jgi:uncharacterized membrane-anchored protein